MVPSSLGVNDMGEPVGLGCWAIGVDQELSHLLLKGCVYV